MPSIIIEYEKNFAQIASSLLQKGIIIVLYKLKEEFFVKHKITEHQWKRRKEDLLEWLKNYYVYEIINGNPIMIDIKEVIGDYQPLPRKKIDHAELEGQKRSDYEEFTIASLGEEYAPNSKAHIAREAIFSFGGEKYGHTNYEYVARQYVKKPFDKHAESNGNHVWVWFQTYIPLDNKIINEWKEILKQEKITVEDAANAFYKQESGQDISKEKNYYKNALKRIREKYHDTPVLVEEWRSRKEGI